MTSLQNDIKMLKQTLKCSHLNDNERKNIEFFLKILEEKEGDVNAQKFWISNQKGWKENSKV